MEENNDIFNELWHTHKFIAVHCIAIPSSFNPHNVQFKRIFYTQIYCSHRFGAIFNKGFLNMVVDPTSQEFHQLRVVNHFIKQKDLNCIVILRLHPITKLIVRSHSFNMINVIKAESPESFEKHLLHLTRDINREIQMEICPSIKHNPLSDVQKRKLDRDRKIMAEQQKAYRIQQQLRAIKRQKANLMDQSNRQPKRRKHSGSQDEEIKTMKQQVMKSVQESILKQRHEKLTQMKKYTPQNLQNPINIKIRYPNGKQIQLTLPKTETLQYVIDYITCQDQVLGFQNQLRRNFIFSQPWNSIDFNNVQNKTFLELFNESSGEILFVKQMQ